MDSKLIWILVVLSALTLLNIISWIIYRIKLKDLRDYEEYLAGVQAGINTVLLKLDEISRNYKKR